MGAMNRTAMNRKPHPNNPFSSLPPRAKPMARVSKTTRARNAATQPHRDAYVTAAGNCERCQCRPATDCHEIPAGSSRHRALWLPNTWLALCRTCHDRVQGSDFLEQFNLKCEAVRRDINRCLGRNEL